MRLADDARHTGFDDAGFLTGDLCKRVAQELRVIQTDIRDDGEDGSEDVGAVEPSSESHFNDCNIYLLRYKIGKSHGGHGLEERGLCLVKKCAVCLNKLRHFALGNRYSVDADPFGEGDEMRAGVQPHFVTRGLQHSGDEMGCRALSVGACHMDCPQFLMRVADMPHEPERVLQTGLVRCRAYQMKRRPRTI